MSLTKTINYKDKSLIYWASCVARYLLGVSWDFFLTVRRLLLYGVECLYQLPLSIKWI